MRNGLYKDCTNEDYHSDSAISRSGIMLFDQSPYHYWANYLNPDRPIRESTPAMDFGSAFHMFALETHIFCDYYEVERKKVLLKDVGRKEYEEYKHQIEMLEKSNKKILTQDQWILINEMFYALSQHEQAWELLKGGEYEQSYFWTDKDSGLRIKCRPDILQHAMIVDLKTCVSASSRAYQRAMIDGGLHVQGAMIMDGVEAVTGTVKPNIINICIEKTYPYAIGIKVISEDAINEGRRKYKEILMRMRDAFEKNEFPSYDVESVELPAWAM